MSSFLGLLSLFLLFLLLSSFGFVLHLLKVIDKQQTLCILIEFNLLLLRLRFLAKFLFGVFRMNILGQFTICVSKY